MLRDTNIYKLYLNLNSNALFTLEGESMYPTLKPKWKVKVKPAEPKEIKSGDIVIFKTKKIICHRIIGKFRFNKKTYFIHKGDAEWLGAIFEDKNLIGKVTDVFDDEGNYVEKRLWFDPFYNSKKTAKFLVYFYLPLFLIKRLIFGRKQNGFIFWIRKNFWKFFRQFLSK